MIVIMIDIKSLYALILNEINTDTLQSIDKNIYSRIADELADMKGRVYEGLERRVRDEIVRIVSDMVSILLEIRLAKYNTNRSSLTYEEMYIVNMNDEYYIRKDFVLQSVIEGRRKVLEWIAEKIKTRRVLIRLLNNIDEFIGADNVRYGAYKAEDIAILPLEDAKRLIDSNYAKEVVMLD